MTSALPPALILRPHGRLGNHILQWVTGQTLAARVPGLTLSNYRLPEFGLVDQGLLRRHFFLPSIFNQDSDLDLIADLMRQGDMPLARLYCMVLQADALGDPERFRVTSAQVIEQVGGSIDPAVRGEAPKLRTWVKEMRTAMDELSMDPAFAERSVNEGFSGGEKKRHEILQMELLKPAFAVLDETDSGLDVDALKIVSEGVNRTKDANNMGVLLITHYTRILKYIKPDFVHVFVAGKIAEQGGPELADRLEAEGYDRYVKA